MFIGELNIKPVSHIFACTSVGGERITGLTSLEEIFQIFKSAAKTQAKEKTYDIPASRKGSTWLILLQLCLFV